VFLIPNIVKISEILKLKVKGDNVNKIVCGGLLYTKTINKEII